MKPCFLIFGYGYTAKALAPQLINTGFEVVGTSRNPHSQEQSDLELKLIDFASKDVEHYLRLATHILISIPPTNTDCDIVIRNFGALIKERAPFLKWVGYLSSTSVYGDHQGEWVAENSVCIPHTETGIARLRAEREWLSFAKENKLPLHVFRLSGIYGSGRNAISRIIQGKKASVFKEGQVFCRVHVDDIVSTLIASINKPRPLSIYNVSDDEPAPVHVVDSYVTSLLNREPLPLVDFTKAQLSQMEQEFYTNNRRVSNVKIKNELKVNLIYPTYREGLAQIFNNDFLGK